MDTEAAVADLKVRSCAGVLWLVSWVMTMVVAVAMVSGCAQMQEGFQDMNSRIASMDFVPRSETVTANNLNLRKEPSTQGAVITQLTKGERVTIKGEEGRWVKVVTKWGRSGWVYGSYLTGFGDGADKSIQTASGKTTTQPQTLSQTQAKSATPQKTMPPPAPIPTPQSQSDQTQAKKGSAHEGGSTGTTGMQLAAATPATKTYTHPHNRYRLDYPAAWKLQEDYTADPHMVLFTAPAAKAEFWVVSTPTEMVGDFENFYLDLVRPLASRYGEAVEIAPLNRGNADRLTWWHGKAMVQQQSKELYKYSLTHFDDTFWSLVMVVRDGIRPQEIDQLNAAHGSFRAHAGAKSASLGLAAKTAPIAKKSGGVSRPTAADTAVFTRIAEPRERAFTILIPKGWRVEGGILRVDPLAQGGPSQSIAAKLDLKIKKDPQGTVMEHWLPDIAWYDPRRSPAGQMGLIRVGGNYQGMTVMPLMSAQQFLRQVVFPHYHPQATNVNVLEAKNLPKLAQAYHQGARIVVPMLAGHLSYDAALLRVSYSEGATQFEETLVTVIEDMGAAGTGMWNNKLTFYMRAPLGQYKKWEPIFSVINHSIKIDHRWMAGEVKGQLIRNKILDRTQKEIQRIGREISEHRYQTNAEIQNDMFLTLMGQEEYVNPYTKEVEIGTDQWQHRWVNESGDVIYTNQEGYNPNTDVHLKRSDYKRTPVRKR